MSINRCVGKQKVAYSYNEIVFSFGNSLTVQWLGLHVSTAVGMSSIPDGENLDPACHTIWSINIYNYNST